MAKNIIVSVIWQLFWFSILFPILHVGILAVRGVVPKLGYDERLFPKKLLTNDQALNQHRIKIADGIFKNFTKLTATPTSVEIRVVASDRGNNFLYQTVIFLLEQQYGTFNYSLSICNVESKIFSDLLKFNSIEIPVYTVGERNANSQKVLNSTLNKENEDYWKCLGAETQSRYLLLIEDDSIIIPQFSKLLQSLVIKLDYHESIDFVKLYHPNYLRKLPSYVLMGALSILISFLSCSAIKSLFKSYPILTFLILSIACFLDLRTHGCQFPADFRFYLTGSAYISYPESCCTPAVIFRQSSISNMQNYFRRTVAFNGHAKDHILDESPFTGRQSDINYVTHIGSFSSVRQRSVFLSELRDI
ncbi:uncharacterized protein CELE_F35C11.4 [Caenorhabditis elegans]|uniref:Transmembrane protein n=1 Tax=Caenorhabditis elegans TaxID=6239 RepID=Q20021_CAEEL|nr:Transmembrane protein [Caenorhabditis elegans]CAA90244.1 Transmembrane protein [Caenorhabditis elegans]|eukprot:NP_495738.1 Uncharacterized protein CELE_F35C11.4 [Caenorhabditis elegans]